MNSFSCAHNSAAVGLSNALMTEADSQYWHLGTQPSYDSRTDSGFLWSARSGGNNDSNRAHSCDFLDRDSVVADKFWVVAQLTKILDEVVCKRVVVVDDQQTRLHGLREHQGVIWPTAEIVSFSVL